MKKGIISDRKSTRLNSSHLVISYAVFCLKKKKRNCNNVQRRVLVARSGFTVSAGTRPGTCSYSVAGTRLAQAPFFNPLNSFFFFLMFGQPPGSTLFPYPTFFQ